MEMVKTRKPRQKFKLYLRRKGSGRVVHSRRVTTANAARMKVIMQCQAGKNHFVDSYDYDLYLLNHRA